MDIVSPLKQLGKYTVGAMWDTVSSYNANVSTLASDAQEIRDNVIHAGKTSIEIFNDFKMNGMKKINDWFWQGENESNEYDLNNPDDDFDAGFQIDNSGYEEEEMESSQILDARSMKDITRGQVNAMYKIGGKQVEAATMNTAEIVNTVNMRSSEIVAAVNNVNTSLGRISKQLDQISIRMSGEEGEKKSRGMSDGITDSEGKLTVGNIVKAAVKELSQYTDTLGMGVDFFKEGMLGPQQLLAMPMSMLMEHKFEKLGNKSVSDYMEDFDHAFGNKMDEFFSSILNSDFIKYNTSMNYSDKRRTNFSSFVPNNYNTDTAKFDGITRQTIIEIIPGYLKSINAALTGTELNVNRKGHLTSGHVDTFSDVASIAMRSDGMSSKTSYRISNNIKSLNVNYNSGDVRLAGRALVSYYVIYMMTERLAVFDNGTLIALLPKAIETLAPKLAASNGKRTISQWTEILEDVGQQIMGDEYAIRDFAQKVTRQCDDLYKGASERATNPATRAQDVVDINLDMVFDNYKRNMDHQNAIDEVRNEHKDELRELRDKYEETDSFHIFERAKITKQINDLEKEQERKLEEVENKFSDNISTFSVSTTKIGENNYKKLESIETYSRSIWQLLNRGINVRVLGKKDPNGFEKMSLKNKVKAPVYPVAAYEIKNDPDVVFTESNNNRALVMARKKNKGGHQSTSSSITKHKESGDDSDGDGDGYKEPQSAQSMTQPVIPPKTTDVLRDITKDVNKTLVQTINQVIDQIPALRENEFVQKHRPEIKSETPDPMMSTDPNQLDLSASDKTHFDFIRTAIDAALSNGNGVEDLGNIRMITNKIKNPKLRSFLNIQADKLIRLNSQKANAENEKQSDPNLPPEKKPGILGGIAQLFLGKATKLFSPILILLKPITSLVRAISKPLIELAKKGFKSGINDIKSGAKQIWQAVAPKSVQDFFEKRKKKSETSSDDIDKKESSEDENKTTADAGEAAGVSQKQQSSQNNQQKMYPLAAANQTYYNATSSGSNTSATTATTDVPNNSQTFNWDRTTNPINNLPQVSTNADVQQPEYKLKDPLAPAKTEDGGNKKDSETSKNTKATGKLASVLGGVASIGQGLLKIALTIIGSLTAVKSAVDLVIRVLKRSVQPLNKGIKRLINSIKPVIKSLGKLVSQLAGFVTKLVDTLMGVIEPLMEILTPVIDAIMVALEPLMQGIDKIVQVAVDIVTPLMPVVQLLLDNATTTLSFITELIDDIITPFTETIQPIIEDLGKTFEPFVNDLMEIITPIRDMMQTTVIDIIGPMFGQVSNILIPIIQDIANIVKLGFGNAEITIGKIETGIGWLVSFGGKVISLLVDDKFGNKMVEAGEKLQQTGESTTKSGLQNVNDAILYFLQRFHLVEKKEEPKKEVEVIAPTTQSNETFHGSVMEGLTGSGDPHNQHSYGGFLNMSDHGCGPIALADMAARRGGGTINAANLALSMANSGAYGINDGTSIGGFMDTAASMGMGTKLGGVTASSLGMASPDNPITIIGSGYGFGTRNGNNHYLNVIGTNGSGGAYVSNPLTGRIEVHSAAGLASSALAGIYGSGDTPPSADATTTSSSVNLSDQIQEIHDATSGLTSIGGNATTTASIDLGSAIEDALADLKEVTSKILDIFNFDGTFESNLKKSVSKTEDAAIISNIHSSMTDEEYENYVSQARALFQQENPKKLFESDKKYEQRFQENLATYLSKVAADDVKTKQVELLAKSYNTQTSSLESIYGKYDPESDSYIDEDKNSITAMVADTVNSKAGTGILRAILKGIGDILNIGEGLGAGAIETIGNNFTGGALGILGPVGDALGIATGVGSALTDMATGGNQENGGSSEISDEGAYGGDNYFSNAIDDANNAGRMVSTSGVRLGGANYYPSITVANVQGNSSSTMTPTPIHEFLSRAAGQSYAWSVDGNWYSKRNTPDTTGQGSTSSSHSGVDILMPDRQSNNVPLYATTDGTVVGIRSGVTGPDHNNNTAGNAVYWTDAAGYKHRFLHMSNTTPLVREGQQIYGGQTLLGYMGNTGDSYGHHLHYDISTPGGTTVNPMTYFQFATGSPQSNSTYAPNTGYYTDNYYDLGYSSDYSNNYSYGDSVDYLNLVGVTGYNDYDNYSGGYSGGSSNSYNSYTPSFANPSSGSSGGSTGSSGKSSGSSSGKTTTTNGKNSGSLTSQLPGVKSANAVKSTVSEKYTNSGLVTDGMNYTSTYSNNKSNPRKSDKIDTVTWHIWAGGENMSALTNSVAGRDMSPTYGIDANGNIAQYVDEGRRPWTSGWRGSGWSNGWKNDDHAVTFEIANVPGVNDDNPYAKGYGSDKYPITDASMQAALNLTVDVARRNGINYFYYTGNKYSDAEGYYGQNGNYAQPGNFTYHDQFAPKACPGEYIKNRTDEIIKTLNQRISQGRGAAIAGLGQTIIEKAYAGEASTLDKDTQAIIDKYTIRRYANDAWEAQSNASHNNMITQAEKRVLAENGIDTKALYNPSNYTSTGTGNTSSTKLNPSAGQKTLDMLSGMSSLSSGSKVDIGGVAANYTGVWNQYLNKFGSEKISNFFETAQNAGLSATEAAIIAAIGVYEDSGDKVFGDKSLTAITYDKNRQAAFGIMNWVPSEKTKDYGSTLEEQMRTIYRLYLSPDATHGRATIQSANYNAYKNALETALGHSLQLQPGQNWADILDEDIMEAMGHMVGNALIPETYATLSGQAKHAALGAEIYNWMVDNGYATSTGIGTSNTDPYKNMGYYLKYLKTGDLSYLDNVTGDMYSIANDLVRYGNYFYNAGGGKSDYNIATAMKDFSSVYQQPDTTNGWVYQDGAGSQAFYYQNGDIIGEAHMGPSGTYEVNWYEDRSDENTLAIKGGKVQYQQPSQPKKPGKTASTNNDGTAKPVRTQEEIEKSRKEVVASNAANSEGMIAGRKATAAAAIKRFKEAKTIGESIDATGEIVKATGQAVLDTEWSDIGKALLALPAAAYNRIKDKYEWFSSDESSAYGDNYFAQLAGYYLKGFESKPMYDAGFDKVKKEKDIQTLHETEQNNKYIKYLSTMDSTAGTLATKYIAKYGSLDAPIASYDQMVARQGLQSRIDQIEAKYSAKSETSTAGKAATSYYEALEQNSLATTRKVRQGLADSYSNKYNEAKAKYDAAVKAYNNASDADRNAYIREMHAAQADMTKYKDAADSFSRNDKSASQWYDSPTAHQVTKLKDTDAMIGDYRFSLSAKDKSKLYDEAKAKYDAAVKAYNNASDADRNAYIREMHAAQADMTKYKAYEGFVSKYEDSRKSEIGNTGIYINNRNDNENRNPIKDRDTLSETDPRFTKLDLTGYPEQMILESHTVSRDKDKGTNKAFAIYSEMAVPNLQKQINELTNKNTVYTPAPSFDTPESIKQAQSLIQTFGKPTEYSTDPDIWVKDAYSGIATISGYYNTITNGYKSAVKSEPYQNFLDKSADFNFGMFNELQETGGKAYDLDDKIGALTGKTVVDAYSTANNAFDIWYNASQEMGGKAYDLDDKIGALTGKTVVDANKAFTVWVDNNDKKLTEQAGRLISTVDSTSSKLKNAYPNFLDKSADFNFGMFNELQETGGNIYDLTYKMAGVDSRGIDSKMAAEYAKYYNGEYSTPEAADAISKGTSSTNSAFNSAFTAFDTGLQNSYSGIKSLAVAGGMAGSVLNSLGTTKASQSESNGLLQGPVTKPTEYKSDAKVYEDFLKSGTSNKPDSSWIYNYVDTDKKKTGMTKDYGKSSVERLKDELDTLFPRSTKTTSKTAMIPDENGYMTLVPESIADVASQIKQANAKSGKTQSDDMLSRISRAKYDMTRESTKPSSFAEGFKYGIGSLFTLPSITKLTTSLFGTKKSLETTGSFGANAISKYINDLRSDPNLRQESSPYALELVAGVDAKYGTLRRDSSQETKLSTNLLGRKYSLDKRISKYTTDQKSTLFQNYIYGKEMITGTKLTDAQKANYAQMFNNSIMPDDFEDYIVEVSHGGKSSHLGSANTLDDVQTVSRPTTSAKLSDYLTNKQSARDKKVTRYTAAQKSARLNDYITGYELATGTKLTDSQKESYAKIINAGGTPEDFKRYTKAVENAEQTKLAQQQAQQFVNSMPKTTLSTGNTEYGSSWTEHYVGYKPNGNSSIYTSISTSDTSTSYNGTWYDDGSWEYNGGADSVTRDSDGYVTYHFGSDTSASEQASTAYTATKEYQNTKQTSTSKQAKLTNAAAKSGSDKASEQASIAYQKTMEMKNKKKGKGDAPDTTPSTLTNVDIPALDLNRLLTPDRTTSIPTPSTYTTTYNSSNSNLNKILNNTFNVRAKRVEELLESIDKKLESFSKNNNGNRPPTSPTGSTSNPFPDNGIPTQIDKLALG